MKAASIKTAGKGAGGILDTPGEGHTLIKHGPAKDAGTDTVSKSGIASSKTAQGPKSAKKAHGQRDDDPFVDVSAMLLPGQTPQNPDMLRIVGEKVLSPEDKVSVADFGTAKRQGRGTAPAQSGDQGMPSGIERLLAGQPRSATLNEASGAKNDAVSRAERKDRKTLIGVRDERKEPADGAVQESPIAKAADIKDSGTVDMSIGFRNAENGSRSLAGESSMRAEKRDGDGRDFASMLSQELRNNAADFVKAGQIVLKENNTGLIRLTLNPESLGNVKISLELSGDKKISGKIVVASREAYEAFNENLEGLSKAFVDGGFESAGFDLSWSGQDAESRQREAEAEAAIRAPFYASSIPDVMSGRERADIQSNGYRFQGSAAVNVFA